MNDNRKEECGVTIDERIAKVQQDYTTTQAERNELVNRANDMLTELTKMEAQFNLLNELKDEQTVKASKSKKATVIEAVPEEK